MPTRLRPRVIKVLKLLLLPVGFGALVFAGFFKPPACKVSWAQDCSNTKHPILDLELRPGGGVNVIDVSGDLQSINPDGSLASTTKPAYGRFWRHCTDKENNLYVGTFSRHLLSLDPGGKQRWDIEIPDQHDPAVQVKGSMCAPGLAPNGEIYVAFNTGELAVLDADGRMLRRLNLHLLLDLFRSPAISTDGSIYVVTSKTFSANNASNRHTLHAFNQNGKELWNWLVPGHSVENYACAPDGTLYVVAHQGKFYALKPDGSIRWSWENPDPPRNGGFHWQYMSLQANGDVYVTSDNRVVLFSPDGSKLKEYFLSGGTGATLLSDFGGPAFNMSLPNYKLWLQGQAAAFGLLSPSKVSSDFGSQLVVYRGGRQHKYSMPGNVWLACGPGPEGEFYGSRIPTGSTIAGGQMSVVRIDPPK